MSSCNSNSRYGTSETNAENMRTNNLKLWLDASYKSFFKLENNSNRIDIWYDRTDFRNNGVTSLSGTKPTFGESNNDNHVYMPGGNDSGFYINNYKSSYPKETLFFVLDTNIKNGSDICLLHSGRSGTDCRQVILYRHHNKNTLLYSKTDFGLGISTLPVIDNNRRNIISISVDNSNPDSTPVNAIIRLNGLSIVKDKSTFNPLRQSNGNRGTTIGYAYSQWFSNNPMKMYEMIGYDDYLSLNDIEKIEMYLGSKWRITLQQSTNSSSSSNNISKLGNYNFSKGSSIELFKNNFNNDHYNMNALIILFILILVFFIFTYKSNKRIYKKISFI